MFDISPYSFLMITSFGVNWQAGKTASTLHLILQLESVSSVSMTIFLMALRTRVTIENSVASRSFISWGTTYDYFNLFIWIICKVENGPGGIC